MSNSKIKSQKFYQQTQIVLEYMHTLAVTNNGVLTPFTNNDTLKILAMPSLKTHGRALGNIQSRIDFACYLCKLPPLGIAANPPFKNSWEQADRSWAYPETTMRIAAKQRQWSNDDFMKLEAAQATLAGRAGTLWKKEMAINEDKIKAWAYGLKP